MADALCHEKHGLGSCGGYCYDEMTLEDKMETSNTRRLLTAFGNAKAGTTTEIAAVCDFLRFPALELDVSVRLIGRGRGITFCNSALEIKAPCIIRNLGIGAAVPASLANVWADLFLEDCSFGSSGPSTTSVLLYKSRLIAKSNSFIGGRIGVGVHPLRSSKTATTVCLEGNTFDGVTDSALKKGPAWCHPQDNAAVLKVNEFAGINAEKMILEFIQP